MSRLPSQTGPKPSKTADEGVVRKGLSVRWYQGAVAIVTVLSLGALGQMSRELREVRARAAASQSLLDQLRPTSSQFLGRAEVLIEQGDLRAAREQLYFALAVAPNDATLYSRLGDVNQSLCDFPLALDAYHHAVQLDARLEAAGDGVVLCERLVRAKESPQNLSETTLYALYRVMVKHDRMAEAIRIASRLTSDVDLQRRTWQERLQRGGLSAVITLNRDKQMSVTIRGSVNQRLHLLHGMPVVHLNLSGTDLRDLTPLADLPLQSFDASGTEITDLRPLEGMPLRVLKLSRTAVEELTPLRGMSLRELDVDHTPVRSIAALRDMPLRRLSLANTRVANLEPLASIPLLELDLSSTPTSDLRALSHLPLSVLRLDDTAVVDLTPLLRAPLAELSLARTSIADLAPLSRSPITVLRLTGCRSVQDLGPLAGCHELQVLNLPTQPLDRQPLAKLERLRLVE